MIPTMPTFKTLATPIRLAFFDVLPGLNAHGFSKDVTRQTEAVPLHRNFAASLTLN